MLNLNKRTKTKSKLKTTLIFKNCSYMYMYTTVVQNTAQNSSDSFPSYPPDSHHSSDDVCQGRRTGLPVVLGSALVVV